MDSYAMTLMFLGIPPLKSATLVSVVRAAGIVGCSLFLFSACWSVSESPQRFAKASDADSALTVEVPGKTIRIDRNIWKPMTNEFVWAANFEQLKLDRRHEFPRVVTVFRLPMSVDRRLG